MARNIEDIQRDIERTRRQLAGTLDELAQRSKPQNFANEAKTAATDKLQDRNVQMALAGVGAQKRLDGAGVGQIVAALDPRLQQAVVGPLAGHTLVVNIIAQVHYRAVGAHLQQLLAHEVERRLATLIKGNGVAHVANQKHRVADARRVGR